MSDDDKFQEVKRELSWWEKEFGKLFKPEMIKEEDDSNSVLNLVPKLEQKPNDMLVAAQAVYEMYTSLIEAGFEKQDALTLVAALIRGQQ